MINSFGIYKSYKNTDSMIYENKSFQSGIFPASSYIIMENGNDYIISENGNRLITE